MKKMKKKIKEMEKMKEDNNNAIGFYTELLELAKKYKMKNDIIKEIQRKIERYTVLGNLIDISIEICEKEVNEE